MAGQTNKLKICKFLYSFIYLILRFLNHLDNNEFTHDVWANYILQAPSEETYGISQMTGMPNSIAHRTARIHQKSAYAEFAKPLEKSQLKKSPEIYEHVHKGPNSFKIDQLY